MKNLRIRNYVLLTVVLFINSSIGLYANECNIKGNISINSKTKVYYLPECGMYNETKVDTRYGEKWFCTEQEAISEGFTKSYKCPSDGTNLNDSINSSTSNKFDSTKSNFGESFTKWFIYFILGSVIVGGIIQVFIMIYEWKEEIKLNKKK